MRAVKPAPASSSFDEAGALRGPHGGAIHPPRLTRRSIGEVHVKAARSIVIIATLLAAHPSTAAQWGVPKAPVIPEADGYVVIPGAAVQPQLSRTYRAVFDATRAADTPTQLVPALNMAGSELNALGVAGALPSHAKFVVVFHGAAIDGILKDAEYKAKFRVSNPNLKVLAAMKQAGVRLFVCGQNLAFAKIDPGTLDPSVTVASDALIVLMTYENDGYAVLSF
jgi:intracellular sulfur oxidation DsrE/DsrF family protein